MCSTNAVISISMARRCDSDEGLPSVEFIGDKNLVITGIAISIFRAHYDSILIILVLTLARENVSLGSISNNSASG